MSNNRQTTTGVPKGSVLGPLFFLVYVNDIVSNLLRIGRLFADDISLAFTSPSVTDLEGILNHDLRIISAWSRQWLVDFNPNKTEALLFTLEKHVNHPIILFGDVPVKCVSHHKHLDITFGNDAKWHEHINNILISASNI